MRKLTAAALALLMMSGAAHAITPEQNRALEITTSAWVAGTSDNCPRFKIMKGEMVGELNAAGLEPDNVKTKEMTDVRQLLMMTMLMKYQLNPSQFCAAAWQLYGPNGLYKRQMLEAK